MKPNCYKCKYRDSVPGDAHSRCVHPSVENVDIIDMALLFGGGNNKMINAMHELNIRADTYGISQGWFLWPANFDPTWLENCDGFTELEQK